MIYAIHPLAEIFPMLPDEELAALADSIAANGLRHPILIAEAADAETGELAEVIIDGRNRLEACRRAGVEPRFERLNGVDVGALILAENVDRRNLNAGQRAMARAMLTKDAKAGRPTGEISRSRDNMGKAEANATSQARFVLRNDPTLAASVMTGAESLNAAHETARARVGAAQSAEAKLAAIRDAAPDLAALVDDGALSLEAARVELIERDRREAEVREEARRSAAMLVDQTTGHLSNILGGMQLGERPPDADQIRKLIANLETLLAKMEG